ncbi:MAG TPA: hypothetical protein VMS21_12995 [Methylomirabilota bacterium]|nr:hypothetical protein [Methylomirabilota bacterium]
MSRPARGGQAKARRRHEPGALIGAFEAEILALIFPVSALGVTLAWPGLPQTL